MDTAGARWVILNKRRSQAVTGPAIKKERERILEESRSLASPAKPEEEEGSKGGWMMGNRTWTDSASR